ncbi:thioredoxin [Streptomyces sp. TverLS-915]|uniref:thioredoxin family protein n=1 Tax=unclassified Streptomyces TaxID=2593676 RepID=UPI0001B559BB|nr:MULTISPECIES: thioredoxin domain-containing protein [unclassified Streptomyces]SCD44907.1 thioredoxin [Streptomyces sp. TverLS-915]
MPATTDVTHLTDDRFASGVLLAPGPVLVEFTATWCPPCRQLAPVLADLARERAGELRVVALDVDEAPLTAARYGVLAAPTMILFRDGEPLGKLVGARSGRRLREELDRMAA